MLVIEEALVELLDRKFEEEPYTDCFLVDIQVKPNNRIEVYIDSDSGITFQTCQRISRYLEAAIEERDLLGPQYVLDVSSPGVGRPIKFYRQYPRNLGRIVELTVDDPELGTLVVSGKLLEVTTEQLTLEEEIREGKKKPRTEIRVIPFDRVKKAVVKVSFK